MATKQKQKSKKQKVVEDKKTSVDSSPSPKEGIVMHAGASRNELMMTAKERGVKNYRVLNKQELSEVLKNIGDQKAVDAIVAGAVDRWKSGWGKGKDKTKAKA
ncbi:MAG: hypothetical protein AUJ74_00675 [Candidatus Omnitrophica bacterium CG1_02_44_16]|nr:MAG: hypothetical protein AUJ74_00675 [Candidatus Omnitrophica bacterium CG1_02_44_16]